MEISPQVYIVLQNSLILVFYVTTLVFIIFTLATTYHWFRFGSSRSINVLSLAIFLVGSTPLFITMTLFLSLM
jgi:hypothetical protein